MIVTGHAITAQRGTVYSWAGLPSEGHPNDFPLTAFCDGCKLPIIRRQVGMPWEHKPEGEDITEPAPPPDL